MDIGQSSYVPQALARKLCPITKENQARCVMVHNVDPLLLLFCQTMKKPFNYLRKEFS